MWPLVVHVRKAQARHAEDSVHVRMQDRLLVLGIRLPERIATEREPGVVEEDVDASELVGRAAHEGGSALLVHDVEREREVGLDSLDPPRPADHSHAGLPQLARGRRADAAGRARDDRGLAGQIHGVRLLRTAAAAKRTLGFATGIRSADPSRDVS